MCAVTETAEKKGRAEGLAEGMEKGQIKQGNPKIIASEIYALIASTLVYKMKNENEIDIIKIYKEFERTVVEGLKVK